MIKNGRNLVELAAGRRCAAPARLLARCPPAQVKPNATAADVAGYSAPDRAQKILEGAKKEGELEHLHLGAER